jgi:hypothetical protein
MAERIQQIDDRVERRGDDSPSGGRAETSPAKSKTQAELALAPRQKNLLTRTIAAEHRDPQTQALERDRRC